MMAMGGVRTLADRHDRERRPDEFMGIFSGLGLRGLFDEHAGVWRENMITPDVHPLRPVIPARITASHLARQAIVYVRQSTLRQVHQHQESGRVQYALKDRAVAWGWPSARVRNY